MWGCGVRGVGEGCWVWGGEEVWVVRGVGEGCWVWGVRGCGVRGVGEGCWVWGVRGCGG